jgi:hypothetical protein
MLDLNRKPGEAVIINHSSEVRMAIAQTDRAALEAIHALPVAGGPAAGDAASAEPR